MEKVAETIAFYEKLCEERPGEAWWVDNIKRASEKLTAKIEQSNFYLYLNNPDDYVYHETLKTIEDLTETELAKIEKTLEGLSCKTQTTRIYKNGTDRLYLVGGQDDEKEKM